MRDAASLLHTVGLTMALGSILTFVVMNIVLGSSTDAALVYHQRLFISAISRALTIPGVCVLVGGGVLAVTAGGQRWLDNRWLLGLVVLEGAVFVNTLFFIAPLVNEVTALAKLGAEHGQMLGGYGARKTLEDRHGAANFIMLAAATFLTTRL